MLFLATSATTSYALFKERRYFDLTVPLPRGFFTKEAHGGPPLTPAKKALTQQWSRAENAGDGG